MTGEARYYRNRQEIRKRKRKMRAYICMGILIVACVFSFWLGKNAGLLEVREAVQSGTVIISENLQDGGQSWGKAEGSENADQSDDNRNEGADAEASVGADKVHGENQKKLDDADGEESGEPEGDDSKGAPWKDFDKSGIVLVNKTHKLPEDYEVRLKRLPDGTNRAAEEAYEPMCSMLKDARKEGIILEVCSSYRSVERQKELFEEDMAYFIKKGYSYLEAYDEAAKDTMPPGYSEHSTGLAFDIVAMDYQMLDSKQEKTEENQWLRENCAKYGFILRYPKEKEDITGITYESWHFRYVGVEIAQYIMKEGIALEEFLEEAS